MKLLPLLLVSSLVATAAFGADELPPLKPGRFLLVTTGDFNIPPAIFEIAKAEGGTFKITSESDPKLSADIIKDGSSYVFSFTIPGKGDTPPFGQDWPKNYYVTYAGAPSDQPLVGLEGVCGVTFTYHHPSFAAKSVNGTFVLYSTEKAQP